MPVCVTNTNLAQYLKKLRNRLVAQWHHLETVGKGNVELGHHNDGQDDVELKTPRRTL